MTFAQRPTLRWRCTCLSTMPKAEQRSSFGGRIFGDNKGLRPLPWHDADFIAIIQTLEQNNVAPGLGATLLVGGLGTTLTVHYLLNGNGQFEKVPTKPIGEKP